MEVRRGLTSELGRRNADSSAIHFYLNIGNELLTYSLDATDTAALLLNIALETLPSGCELEDSLWQRPWTTERVHYSHASTSAGAVILRTQHSAQSSTFPTLTCHSCTSTGGRTRAACGRVRDYDKFETARRRLVRCYQRLVDRLGAC